MKAKGKSAGPGRRVVALALTWDGSRWPTRSLPIQARRFLASNARARKVPADLAKLLAQDKIAELRICWMPRLSGGSATLCFPFATRDGLRIHFRTVAWRRFGDLLGAVYRCRPRRSGSRKNQGQAAPE